MANNQGMENEREEGREIGGETPDNGEKAVSIKRPRKDKILPPLSVGDRGSLNIRKREDRVMIRDAIQSGWDVPHDLQEMALEAARDCYQRGPMSPRDAASLGAMLRGFGQLHLDIEKARHGIDQTEVSVGIRLDSAGGDLRQLAAEILREDYDG